MADSLAGLRVGDALGEAFFGSPEEVRGRIARREMPSTATWTDDTLMACSLATVLAENGGAFDDQQLVGHFARYFDMQRGYGHLTFELLHNVRLGHAWRPLVEAAHGGQGSWGNGAAMRAAPLGAYWFDDLERAATLARQQARVTHGNHEAAEGAVAVALAAGLAASSRGTPTPSRTQFLELIASYLLPGLVLEGMENALQVGNVSAATAARLLGSGQEVAAFDTVPFALWAARGNLDDFESGFWTTVAGLGDRDTTCAMAGGVIAARLGVNGIASKMLDVSEPLPDFVPLALASPAPPGLG